MTEKGVGLGSTMGPGMERSTRKGRGWRGEKGTKKVVYVCTGLLHSAQSRHSEYAPFVRYSLCWSQAKLMYLITF